MAWVAIALLLFCLAVVLRADWPLLRSPRQFTVGQVTGHRRSHSDGAECFAPIVSFRDATGGEREVIDEVYGPRRIPEVGSALRVVYPVGRPDQARVFHPWLRLSIYVFLVGTLVLLLFFREK